FKPSLHFWQVLSHRREQGMHRAGMAQMGANIEWSEAGPLGRLMLCAFEGARMSAGRFRGGQYRAPVGWQGRWSCRRREVRHRLDRDDQDIIQSVRVRCVGICQPLPGLLQPRLARKQGTAYRVERNGLDLE